MMENTTISLLEYFEDTLSNVGLPEAWLRRDSNFVTRLKINTLDVSQIESKKQVHNWV